MAAPQFSLPLIFAYLCLQLIIQDSAEMQRFRINVAMNTGGARMDRSQITRNL